MFVLKIRSGEITGKKLTKQELSFLPVTLLLDHIYVSLESRVRPW